MAPEGERGSLGWLRFFNTRIVDMLGGFLTSLSCKPADPSSDPILRYYCEKADVAMREAFVVIIDIGDLVLV